MAKLKQLDLAFWQLFVEACGGRCNACGKSGVPLERGHLQRHADGGAADDYHNLIPLCRPCNAKNRNGLTDDTRPVDWLDAFVGLIHAKLGTGIRLKMSEPTRQGVNPLKPGTNGGQVTENTGLLNWSDVEFVASNVLYPTQKRTAPLKPLTDKEATHLIERTVKYGAEEGKVALPLLARKGKLIQLAKGQVTKHGEAIFTKAMEEFVKRNELRKCTDPWGVLCDNFELYLEYALARERAEREAKQKLLAAEREAAERQATEPPRPAKAPNAMVDTVSKECLDTIAWITENLEAVSFWNAFEKAKIAKDLATMRTRINNGVASASDMRRFRDWLNSKAIAIRRAAADALQSA